MEKPTDLSDDSSGDEFDNDELMEAANQIGKEEEKESMDSDEEKEEGKNEKKKLSPDKGWFKKCFKNRFKNPT